MKSTSQKSRSAESGAAIITSIMALLLVTLLGFAMVSVGLTAMNVSNNDRQQTEAFYIAEAGLTHATNLVKSAGSAQFTNILKAGDLTANTGDELSTQPSANTPIPKAGLTFGRGRYTVRVSDDAADTDGNDTAAERNTDTNARLVITSTGVGRDGATATIEAIIGVSGGLPALLINGKLRINGNLQTNGSNGAVHANDTLDFDGNPCASQYFSSSTNIIDSSKALGAGCTGIGVTRQNQPIIAPPVWNIRADFRDNSDYVLIAINDSFVTGSRAGDVYMRVVAAGITTITKVHNGLTSNDWKQTPSQSIWTWESGNKNWKHGGSALPTGTYYSEGNMEIGDEFGVSSPVVATLIAEGYINISGNPRLSPKYQNYSMMAGMDLRINGNPAAGTNSSSGIHYARHQIEFNGNPNINGIVIGANIADTGSPNESGLTSGVNLVPLQDGFTVMNGNPIITYDGSLLGGGGAAVVSWREVRY